VHIKAIIEQNHVKLPDGSRVTRAQLDPMEQVAALPSRDAIRGVKQSLGLTGDGSPELDAPQVQTELWSRPFEMDRRD